jgi:hypothetical protein
MSGFLASITMRAIFVALLETDVRPVLAGVERLVHPIADRRVVARILLAGADVDDVRITGRDRDRADRADVCLSKIGLNVTPPFVVLMMPPFAPAT